MARKFGMKVDEFGFGFPPRALGWYKDQNGKWQRFKSSDSLENLPSVLYSINWLPLGGFVKIKGESGEERNARDSFAGQKVWRRLVVLLAGVFMNFVVAAILLGIGFGIGLPTDLSEGVDEHAIVVESSHVVIESVEKDSPAQKAGLQLGDAVVSIEGKMISNSPEMLAAVKAQSSNPLSIAITRAGAPMTFSILPVSLNNGEAPRLGVSLVDAGLIRYPWFWAIIKGFVAAGIGAFNILVAFYLLLKSAILGRGLAFAVSGPVGIAVIVGQSAQLGIRYLLNTTAMISLSLAVVNFLPIPALDGGRALFVIIEKIIRRPVSAKYEQMTHTIGFALLMILVVLVTVRDVRGLF